MAYRPSAVDASRELSYPEGSSNRASRRSLLLWLFDAMMASRQRQIDREIARYAGTGGKFTDEAEREIERRVLSTPSRW